MGLTVLDAGVLIGLLDGADAHHAAARSAFETARAQNDRLVLPASALAEVLVGPSRRGADAIALVRDAIDRIPIEVAALDDAIAATAAGIRARHRSVKLPDALVIATAIDQDADQLVTTDRGWPSRAKLGLRATIVRL